MTNTAYIKSLLVGGICSAFLLTGALAQDFNISGGDLKTALGAYMKEAGVELMYPDDEMKGVHTKGANGNLSADAALLRILAGTGFVVHHASGAIVIVHDQRAVNDPESPVNIAAAMAPTASGAALETVTVTSSKLGGDVQNIPIAISAFSQEQLTSTQTTGGPDLVKQVPNLTFSKTNFSGYNIQIRGIGTQAISVSTDPAVAVAFNDIPFIRNHFFEQEFYDVGQLEVLRGPQGTLYGRNATAGVVNVVSAKPTDQFEAQASADLGNYDERRFEGMINIPIVDDRFDLRIAGEWTKRGGYVFNETDGSHVDGRDLWSSRVTIGWKPLEQVQTYLVWEHFSEDDDRLRSGKQLCKTAPTPTSIDGVPVPAPADQATIDAIHSGTGNSAALDVSPILSQGCEMTSLYSPDAFQVPNGFSQPFVAFGEYGLSTIAGDGQFQVLVPGFDPFSSTQQSPNLRVIQSALKPSYKAKNDTLEFNADYALTPTLTLTSQTGFNNDFLYSTEDLNRFDTAPGIFTQTFAASPGGVFCDPQLGCSTRVIAEDLSDEHAWQLSQEFRLASNFGGPFNFSAGGNYLHYETEENFYVFNNLITADVADLPGCSDASCADGPLQNLHNFCGNGVVAHIPLNPQRIGQFALGCEYIDQNPLSGVDNNGHNYFVSQNPYTLNSYAGFGEAYYKVLDTVKLTGGLRWTDDRKHFIEIPSETAEPGWGYPISGVIDQQWQELTGRGVVNWTPKLDFTDQTLVYASYSRGYKAGGANPPGPGLTNFSQASLVQHPLTFLPEFINAYEAGTKDTLLDGTLTLNGDIFYYDYKNYQISQLVDRTSINLNFNANVRGAELESTWEPIPGLRLNFAGGYEDAKLGSGSQAIDFMDRTAGHTDWTVIKPWVNETSNCIIPTATVVAALESDAAHISGGASGLDALECIFAYRYDSEETGTFDPSTAPNDGAGFDKNLAGNRLPNAPPFTVSLGAQYTMPLSSDWAGTLRGDYYWQDYSWARVFNDNPYDRLRGYTNINLTLIFTNQDGWQVMLYDKNVLNTTAITGDFLYTDDVGLTTNVFLTDPRLVGIRVTKNW